MKTKEIPNQTGEFENVQKAFEDTYLQQKADLLEMIGKSFLQKSDKTADAKFIMILKDVQNKESKLSSKIDKNGSCQLDAYTCALFNNWNQYKFDYKSNSLVNFLDDHLENIRDSYQDRVHLLPKNYHLDIIGIAILLGKYDAFFKILKSFREFPFKSSVFGVNEYLLHLESDFSNIESYPEEIEEYEINKGFNKKRRILFINFLLNNIGVKESNTKKTKIAILIRDLTDLDTGSKTIGRSNIYKYIGKKVLSKDDKDFFCEELKKLIPKFNPDNFNFEINDN